MYFDNVYDLIQGQVFIFTDNIMGSNGVSQVNAIAICMLAKGVNIGRKAWVIKRREFDGLVVRF